jgi:hypothetical protein
MAKDSKLNSLMKMKKQKLFATYEQFFNDVSLLTPQFIDHDLLHRTIGELFELVPYLKK